MWLIVFIAVSVVRGFMSFGNRSSAPSTPSTTPTFKDRNFRPWEGKEDNKDISPDMFEKRFKEILDKDKRERDQREREERHGKADGRGL